MPERKERLAVLRDSLRDPQGRWLRGAVWVLVLAALGAWLAVEAVALVRSEQRQHERNQLLEGMEQTLLSESSNGPLLGMVTLLGLSEPSLKAAAQGFLPYDAPPVLARLGVIRGRFMVDGAYVIARDGTVVAHDTAGNRTTGAQLGHRPYFQQALQGNASVYAALGGTSQERGLYYAAPLYESDTPSSPIIGVVTVKVGFSHFDRLLTRAGHPVLLMSPQGVVFSSTRPEWLYAMTAPLTQERIDAVRSTRQFGSRFDNGLVSALPFSIDSREALIDGVRYAVGRRAVDWKDPAGPWQLVLLDDMSAIMPMGLRWMVGGGAFALFALVGAMALDALRNRRRLAESMQRFSVLGAALENSPISIVITDAEGVIAWVNPQYERNTGYTLGEVRGRKPSIAASEHTPAGTYRDMWSRLLAGHSWRGRFVNRRRDGTLYHEEATLSPVFDAKGRRIAIVGLLQDVTARIEAAQELERRERRLSELLEQQTALFDNAPPIVLVCDGQIRQFNRALAELLRSSDDALAGTPVQDLFAGEAGYGAFTARTVPMLLAGGSVREQAVLRRPDGTSFTARMAGRGLKMEGVQIASLWVIEDVTEAQRAEAATREANARLELAQEAGHIGVFDYNLLTQRMVWSPQLEQLYGAASLPAQKDGHAAERPFQAWVDVIHPEDRARVQGLLAQAQAGQGGGRLRDSWRIVRADGSTRWILCTARVVRDEAGQAARIIGVQVDVHDQKMLEARVAEQLAFQQALIDAIPVPLFYKDAQGRYLGFNRAYVQAFDIHTEDFIGKTVLDLEFLPMLERERLHADTEAALRGAQSVHREMAMPYADGLVHHTMFWLHGFNRPDGSAGGVIGTFVDVSDRQRAEVELRRAKELAEETAALKSRFLANMSHEIRTPLNAIIGMSHLALKSGLDARQSGYVVRMQQAGQHLLGVINDILDFSKIEAGKLVVERSPFALDRMLEGVADVVGFKAAAKGLELVLDVAPDVPQHLVGDALRLGQILINFANNAVKFTEQGEIHLLVRLERDEGARVLLRFEVRDTGIGIAPQQMQRLFQSFEQADSSTTRRYGGTGLGLAISKSLAELMGGEVGVRSEPGQGSAFWIIVPLVRGEPLPRALLRSDWRGCRVLVVDDNHTAAQVLVDMLQTMGLQATQVHSGVQALQALRDAVAEQRPYGLLLLDWHMPGMDGIELARRIRGLGLAHIPQMLMVTAHGRDEVMDAARSEGIDNVLVKPVSASVLFDTLMQPLAQAWDVHPLPRSASGAAPAVLRGAVVLLVEDNELNQIVAQELLRDAGMHVDVASNGQEAIACIDRRRYDVVLMDMQMPVMDGETATRQLRADPRHAGLPIIAMTANAMQADRERCFAAGMNDHVPKPIDPEVLWATLVRWLSPRPEAASHSPAPPANAPLAFAFAPALPQGVPGLDTALGLKRASGKPGLYAELLQRFALSQSDVVQNLQAAIQAEDWALAERTAHTLRSVAANLGAQPVSRHAQALEQALRSQAPAETLQPLLAALAGHMAPLLQALGAWARQAPGADAREATVPPQTPAQLLRGLRTLLRADDPAAGDYLQRNAAGLAALLGADFDALERSVRSFAYDDALRRLEACPAAPAE